MKECSGNRGQVFPIWLFGILMVLLGAFYTIDYGNILWWQIRAQNAADNAAQAAATTQAQDFNRINLTLYTMTIEEFRIRGIIEAVYNVANKQGGCQLKASTSTFANECFDDYKTLTIAYLRAENRYSRDVQLLSEESNNMDIGTQQYDMTGILSRLWSSCGGGIGFDCAFYYTMPNSGTIARTGLGSSYVGKDAYNVNFGTVIPGTDTGAAAVNPNLFAPLKFQVAVCRNVTPLIQGFWNFRFPTISVMASGAATPVAVTSEWMEPGVVKNPINGLPFQATEYPIGSQYPDVTSSSYDSLGGNVDWYAVEYGAVRSVSTGSGYTTNGAQNGLEVMTNWWSTQPVHPFVTGISSSSISCHDSADASM